MQKLIGPRHGGISKEGAADARHMLVEAAWIVARTPGPLRAYAQRIRVWRGTNIATVAVARKLAVLFWHLLTREEDYAFAPPSLTRQKVRLLELSAGAARRVGYRNPVRVLATKDQHQREREVAVQAEVAYRRLVKDWTAHKGAGAATGARIPKARRAPEAWRAWSVG